MGNITFARANSPFGWYDEESSTTPGKEIVYKEYFLLVFIWSLKARIDYVSRMNNILQQKLFI